MTFDIGFNLDTQAKVDFIEKGNSEAPKGRLKGLVVGREEGCKGGKAKGRVGLRKGDALFIDDDLSVLALEFQ